MKLLMDTHVFLWAIGQTAKLSAAARSLLADERNELLLSAASLWEIALKIRARKLAIPEKRDFFTTHLTQLKATVLPVEGTHVLRVLKLPDHHRDPFDRLLVAQCQVEGIPLVSADDTLRQYPIKILW